MKKTAIALVLVLVLATAAMAASVPSYGTDPGYTTKFNLFSTSTSTGNGSVVQLGKPFSDITCVVTVPTGVAPTNVNITVSGGLDSTNLVSLGSFTVDAFPGLITTRSATAKPVTYTRGTLNTITGGTTPSIRIDCIASH